MELAIPLETLAKTPNRSKILVGYGVALGEIQTLTTKIGADKEIEHSPLALASLPTMKMRWTFR